MPIIEGFRIKNFKTLKNITLGKLWNSQDQQPLTPLTVVIGMNGVGKSSLFDAFGFLSDCLHSNVEEACDAHDRGGFSKLISQGQDGIIEFEIYYRENKNSRPVTYELTIGLDTSKRPYVQQERLRQRRKGVSRGQPFSFLNIQNGRGEVWKGESNGINEPSELKTDNNESGEKEYIELTDSRRLGIAALGTLAQHPRIVAFRHFMEGWYLSYFMPDAARSIPMAGPQKHLSIHGDNLGNVVQYMEREHKKQFQNILDQISKQIPGIQRIDTKQSDDGRLLLRFFNEGFDNEPLYALQMSDGTLKVFAYLLLLKDPSPAPFLCIEEPENGLYHKLLQPLAQAFREHANQKGGSQVFVTTHQPYFVNALSPNEVWVLEKGKDGFATIRRACDKPIVTALVEEGFPLGGLWYSDYLDSEEN